MKITWTHNDSTWMAIHGNRWAMIFKRDDELYKAIWGFFAEDSQGTYFHSNGWTGGKWVGSLKEAKEWTTGKLGVTNEQP